MIHFFMMMLLMGAPAVQAREITGRQAQSLYEALRNTGIEPDNYAGGAAVEAASVQCRLSRHTEGEGRYRCEITEGGGGTPHPTAAETGDSIVDRLQEGAAKVEGLLARGDAREARRALGQFERDLQVFKNRNGGSAGDFTETLQGLQRYLVCEERMPAGAIATTAEKAREFVLYALKVNDPRRLSQHVDCGAGLGVEASEFDRPHDRLVFAQRLQGWREGNIAVVGAGEPLTVTGFKGRGRARMTFRQHPKDGRWLLWAVVMDRG